MLKSNAETTFHKGKQKFRSAVMFGTRLQKQTNNYQTATRKFDTTIPRLVFIWEFKRKCLVKSVVVAGGRNTALSIPKDYFLTYSASFEHSFSFCRLNYR